LLFFPDQPVLRSRGGVSPSAAHVLTHNLLPDVGGVSGCSLPGVCARLHFPRTSLFFFYLASVYLRSLGAGFL